MKIPIRYSSIYLEIPTSVINITNIELTEELNEHGTAEILLRTDDTNKYNIINELTPKTEVKVCFVTDEVTEVVFVGLPTKVEASVLKTSYQIRLRLKSKSSALDIKKRRRSFQDKENPYASLFNQIAAENQAFILDSASNGAVQGESIIQYDETDWEFIKRLASKLKVKLITNVRGTKAAITVGPQVGSGYVQNTYAFSLENEAGEFLESQINYGEWLPEQKIHYEIESIFPYFLYDNIQYEQIVFKIVKKVTYLKDGIIRFRYSLQKQAGVRQDLIVNPAIAGVAIEGIVLDVKLDRLKLHLEIDEKQPVDKAYWYKIETFYTTEGNTGFYSMPEKGDRVELYFPKNSLEDGYVRTSRRMDGESNPKTQTPSIKNYRTPNKKEIMLAPTEMQFTTKNGYILLNMDNSLGIEVSSSGDINIRTNDCGKVNGKKVAFRAGKEILLATKHSSVIVEKQVNFKADGTVSGV